MTKLFHTRVDNLAHIPHREIVTIMLPCVLHKAHQVRLAIVITAALDGFGHQKATGFHFTVPCLWPYRL